VRVLLETIARANLEAFAAPQEPQFHRILMSDGLRLARDGRINLYERMSGGRDQLHDLMRRLMRDGWLRPGDVSATALAFFSPLFMWRQLHAIGADLPMVQNPDAFVREHVERFLLGAAAPAAVAPAPRSSRPRRPSSRSTASSRRRP